MDDQTQRIADLIRQGRKLEAIKLFSESTGADLARSKEEIERIAANMSPETREAARLERIDSVPEDILEIARGGNRIEAIKQLRERTGLGLKEAKDRIDEATGHTGKGCMGALLFVASAGTLLAVIL